jgi:hypothetical protein
MHVARYDSIKVALTLQCMGARAMPAWSTSLEKSWVFCSSIDYSNSDAFHIVGIKKALGKIIVSKDLGLSVCQFIYGMNFTSDCM